MSEKHYAWMLDKNRFLRECVEKINKTPPVYTEIAILEYKIRIKTMIEGMVSENVKYKHMYAFRLWNVKT